MRKIAQLVLASLLVLVTSLAFAGTTLASVVAPQDQCSGVFTVNIGASQSSINIHDNNLSKWNILSTDVAMTANFTGTGTMNANYAGLEGTTDISVADTSSRIDWTKPAAAGVGIYSKDLILARGVQAPMTAIDFVVGPDTTGYLTVGTDVIEYHNGGFVERNENPSVEPNASITFEQLVAGSAAPFTSNAYKLSGQSPMTLSAASTPWTPVAVTGGVGGTKMWSIQLARNEFPANVAIVTYICGGQQAVAPASTPAPNNTNYTCNFDAAVIGHTMYATTTVNRRSGPGQNWASQGQISAGTAVYVTAFQNCWISDGNSWYYANLFTLTNGGNGGNTNTAAPACHFANGTDANGVWTLAGGTTYSAPVMIVVPKNSDGSNRFSARSVVYGSWTTPSGGGHSWQYEPANCDVNAELAFMPTTP